MTASVSQVLSEAADLLAKPGAWTQGAWSSINSSGQKCFCVRGAIRRCGVGINSQIDFDIAELMGFRVPSLLARWNDDPHRTQPEVVDALRRAAALAKEQGR